jgi:two-component system sensor histidine kinase TctE
MVDRSGPSLRGRITTLAVLLLLSAAGLLVIFIADYAHRSADRAFDRLLAASALTIAGAVTVEDGAVVLELPFAAFAMFPGDERVFHAVQDPGGNHVTGYGDLAQDLPPATQTDPVFANGTRNGEQIRIVTVGRLVATARTTGWVTIRVAETRGTREALAAEILRNAMAPLAILTLLAVAFVWVVVGRAFRPLAILDHALRNRSPDDLSPVDVPVPVEVQQLVGGLNSFMARLLAAMERMSGLVAEAAHEVRNPLASLRAQAELALSEDDPKALRGRLERLHDLSVHASHLVTQLLMDATISHRLERRDWQDVPVGALAAEVAGRLDPDSRPRVSVDVGRNATRSLLRGDRVGLREMLRNLVENALAYSDGPVRIAADLAGDTLVLAVEDIGAGIPDEEKDEVVKRFARGSAGAGTVGSGLGLAIVMRVAAGHGGTLRLLDRPGGGLRAEIRLPLATAVPRVATAAAAFAFLIVLALPIPAAMADPALYPAPAAGTRELVIAGTTDTALFSGFIHGFQTENPAVSVMYTELDSLSLFAGAAAGTLRPVPDLLISSASDLQLLLANDGHGIPAVSPHLARVPAWAQWRREVVGFTFEPAVIIYNPDLLAEAEVPRTHLSSLSCWRVSASGLTGA